MRAVRKTINNQLFSRGYRANRPTRKPLLTANHPPLSPLGVGTEVAEPDKGSLAACHLQSRFQPYPVDGRLRVCRLPGERFHQRCQTYGVQNGGSSVHVWGAFQWCKIASCAPRQIPHQWALQGHFAKQLRAICLAAFRWQLPLPNDNATPHRAWVVLEFIQQGNVTKIEQPARSPDCIPIEHIWDYLGCAITSMDNPPQNLGELLQALLDKWAEIPVKGLERYVAGMLRHLVAILAAGGRNTCYWPGMHKTIWDSITQKSSLFDRINHNYHPMTFSYAYAANFSNSNECHHKYTKIHIKQNSAHNT